MPNSPLLWFVLATLFLCFVLIAVLWAYTRNVKAKLLQSVGLIDELHKLSQAQTATIDTLKAELKSELSQALKQTKILHTEYDAFSAEVVQRMDKVEDTVERIAEQDPALKMYSRASKLVAQGAAMEDIIEASGLPRAEVEVLVALHARK